MKYNLKPDFPIDNATSKKETGKTLDEWFAEFDAMDGLKKGRRALSVYLNEAGVDPWWCNTISVEYEAARDVRKKDGLLEGYFICATKTIGAPLADTYRKFTSPEGLAAWMGEGTRAEIKDGGSLTGPDGEKATLTRVRENKDLRLSFEHPDFTAPSVIDVQFHDKAGKKTMVYILHQRLQTKAEADGVREAWGEACDRLKKLIEG
ncbi:MAG: SRPBCC domain-containing protein [Fimbriimonadaceae bacterium]|nr:SRPBCC domain-containing protein [Chthonomonadaceae bacterium]MCO5295841.1 SRPBCC domain-containing protein [Fimbriimonadaceae bacterium]